MKSSPIVDSNTEKTVTATTPLTLDHSHSSTSYPRNRTYSFINYLHTLELAQKDHSHSLTEYTRSSESTYFISDHKNSLIFLSTFDFSDY